MCKYLAWINSSSRISGSDPVRFGKHCDGDILHNYSPQDDLATVSRVVPKSKRGREVGEGRCVVGKCWKRMDKMLFFYVFFLFGDPFKCCWARGAYCQAVLGAWFLPFFGANPSLGLGRLGPGKLKPRDGFRSEELGKPVWWDKLFHRSPQVSWLWVLPHDVNFSCFWSFLTPKRLEQWADWTWQPQKE